MWLGIWSSTVLPLVSYLRVNMTGVEKSDERIRVRCKATKSDSDSPKATSAHNLSPLFCSLVADRRQYGMAVVIGDLIT
jgi:hypothetical protein